MSLSPPVAGFAERLLAWFDGHGRHELPWQQPRSPYRVWLSEVMLQQTQVTAVIPYFQRFVARFPDFSALAEASEDEVMRHWAGLGYYARARNLHAAAKAVMGLHGGEIPSDFEAVLALPGVGRSTAGAILAQAYGQRHAILDGNVKRVLARWAAVEGWPGESAVAARLWQFSEALLPPQRLADYTQALMDLGATLCTARRPRCQDCPLSGDCLALRQDRIAMLPTPKPKASRPRPQREVWLILAEDVEGRWLMERRPGAGIWGGLWCPPMVERDQDWREPMRVRHGLELSRPKLETPINHVFSHFDLLLHPVRAGIERCQSGVREDSDRAWHSPAQLHAGLLALPAPISRLVSGHLALPDLLGQPAVASVRRPRRRRSSSPSP